MNFLRQGFRKLSSDRQTDTTEIIYHATSLVVNKYVFSIVAKVCKEMDAKSRKAKGRWRTVLYSSIGDREVTCAVSERTSDLLSAERRCRLAASISNRSAAAAATA